MSFDKKEVNHIKPNVFFYLLKNHFPHQIFFVTKNILQIFCIWQKPDFTVYKNYRDYNPLMGTTKFRQIHAPNVSMRLIHGFFIKGFLRKLPIGKELRFATGGRKGWNPLRNVERHKYGRFFYLIDIKDFYNNINSRKLSEILCSLDKRLHNREEEMFEFLKRFFLLKNGNGLITGAPASVDLANIYLAYTVDNHLAKICQRSDVDTYTRYLDDLTFSSTKPFGKRLRKKIRQTVVNAGFGISHHKSRNVNLWKGPIVITGIGIKAGGETFLPRNYLRKIDGAIHLYKKGRLPFIKVQGMMSAFFATTKKRNPNSFNRRTDGKVVWKYIKAETLHRATWSGIM